MQIRRIPRSRFSYIQTKQVMQKFKKAAKSGRKMNRLCRYPAGQKFCRNPSISLRFQDKQVFVFSAEIQDGRQKFPGKSFSVKLASRLATYPAGQKFHQNHSISLCFRDKRVFAFNAEIKDSRQKWWENDLCKKLLIDSTDNLWVKNFVEIALSRPVSAFNAEIQDCRQKWRENIF